MSQAHKEFLLAQREFEKTLENVENEVVQSIRDKINLTGKNITTWQIQELATVEERLARYTETLGAMYANHDTQAEWTKVWIENEIAKNSNEEKEILKQIQGKVTQSEIERSLKAKYWQETSEMILLKGQAKKYKAILSAVDRVMLAITHRIRQLEEEYRRSNK